VSITITAHHTSFPIRNLERSRTFYEDVLGLKEIPRPDLGFRGAWYAAGPFEVHLIEVPEGVDVGESPPSLNPLARHAAFSVTDYAATVEHLKSHGLEVLETGAEIGQMWVRDPDGHIIELIVARR
jgi:glyoxylase I family protein